MVYVLWLHLCQNVRLKSIILDFPFLNRNMTETEEKKIVFPGHVIKAIHSLRGVTIIGPGLRRNEEPNTMRVTRFGTLHFKAPNTYWVESKFKRYIPKKGDLVVGVVVKKSGDILKVDIGSSETASLSMLAFEGATKKQKPDVQVGDAVYARVLNAHREMEPELVCVDSYYKAGRLGVLPNEGFLFDISIDLAIRLLSTENTLLRTLGKKFIFEIAIGMNGKVWLNCNSKADIKNVVDVLQAAENQSDKWINKICKNINR